MSKVFIGVGHGGSDPGAVANGLRESDLNLSIALSCREELERHGVKVLMSRYKDENDDINEEIRECNAYNPDYAIDIHNNAGGGDGAEVYHSISNGAGKTFAKNVHDEIVASGQNGRGIKSRVNTKGADYYGFIRSTYAPAIIVECAFVDNKTDIAIIDTPAEQKKMGVAIAKGVLKTIGIEYVEKQQTGATDNAADAYATDAVKWAIDNGILRGDEKGNYKLHSNISRQDMIVFLYRALKK